MMDFKWVVSSPYKANAPTRETMVYVWKVIYSDLEWQESLMIPRYVLACNAADAINTIEAIAVFGGMKDDGFEIVSIERFTDAVYAAPNVNLVDEAKLQEWKEANRQEPQP